MQAALAGALYFLVVFGAGFALGTIRTLAIEPSLGALGAVLVELPLILAASWFSCRTITRSLAVPHRFALRLVMGGVAFCLLIFVETAMAFYGFGRSLEVQVALLASPAGAVGLSGQIAFALFPLVQSSRRNAA